MVSIRMPRPLLWCWVCLVALLVLGCVTEGEPAPFSAEGVDADDGGEAGEVDGAPDAGGDASSDTASESEVAADTLVADTTDASDDAEASDAPLTETPDGGGETPISTICGDGIRDLTFSGPTAEECDHGATSLRALCQACRSVDLLALPAAASVDAGIPLGKRSLGLGRHTVAADASGLAVVLAEDKPWRLLLTRFNALGVASDVATPIGGGAAPLVAAHPVVTAVPGGHLVVWTDGAVDGDGPGIAARFVGPSSLGAVFQVNTVAGFTQSNADVLTANSQVVVAWTDASSTARGSDVKARLFSAATLAPLGGELELGATLDDEGDVALAAFGTGWMAAWRAGAPSGASETVVAKVDGKMFYAGPQAAGPLGAKPALAEMDATHALLAYLIGAGDGTFEARVAVLDTTATVGTVTGVTVATKAREVNLVRAGGKVWMTWRADAAAGDANGEELWLKELALGTSGADLTKAALTLPRSGEHRVGDQRQASLAAWAGGLVGIWEDFGSGLAATAMHPDVVVQFVGVPFLRLGGGDGGT